MGWGVTPQHKAVLSQGRLAGDGWWVVGGDGLRYRRRIQQAAHYVFNDTIVNSLASLTAEVKGGVNMLD